MAYLNLEMLFKSSKLESLVLSISKYQNLLYALS